MRRGLFRRAPTRPLIALTLALLAAGCSFRSHKEGPPLVASLKQKPVPVLLNQPPPEHAAAKAIEAYRQAIRISPSGDLQAEARQRLADLSLEKSAQNLGDTEAPPEETGTDFPALIAMYEALLKDYPDQRNNDRVLYQLSRAYDHNGQREQALATLDRLVERYPQSPLIAEAQFRRGETLFADNDFDAAAAAYRAVLTADKDTLFHDKSLYKLGWAQLRQSRYNDSADTFIQLMDRKFGQGRHADREKLSAAERDVLDDIFRGMSLDFYYQAGPASAAEYFENHGRRPYEALLYTALGDIYLDKERYTDAARAYRTFVERSPLDQDAPLLQIKTVETYEKGGFSDDVLQAKRAYVETYNLGQPFWEKREPAQLPDVVAHAKSYVTDLAGYHHAKAQASHAPADYQEAARWYRAYLGPFADDPQAPRMNFLLAEILFENRQYQEAVREYEHTAYGYPPHEKSAESGYAALVAYEAAGKSLEGRALAQSQRNAIGSGLRFAGTFPDHPQSLPVLTKAASDLFRLNEPEPASRAAETVVKRADAPPGLRQTAWTVLGHIAFDKEDFLQAEKAYQEAIALLPPGVSEERKTLTDRLAASVYKQGESQQTAGNPRDAAAQFQRVAQLAPGTAIAATAEYDAAAALLTLEDWAAAITVLERFRTTYPANELQNEVTRKLALAYLKSQQPAKAAVEVERMSQMEGDPRTQREALWQAAQLYKEAGQTQRQLKTLAAYIERFPKPVEPAVEARHLIAEAALKIGDKTRYLQWQRDIIQAHASAGAAATERTRVLAAQASLALAEDTLDDYLAVKLKAPLKKSLAQKKQSLETSLKAYDAAASYGVAEVTTAATYRTAEMYQALARELIKSDRPEGLNAEELEQYDTLLEEQAFPFEEKAIGLHEKNAARAAEDMYDDWVKRSFEQLRELLPARYARNERREDFVEARY